MTNLNVKMKDTPQPEENIGSFYMGRMRPSAEPRRVLPRGMLTAVTLFSFAAIIWYAYPRGQERYSEIDIPVIAADKAAYKFKPEDPGGMEVLHQDSTVFDPLEKKAAGGVEKLRPKPEEPIAKPEAARASSPIDKTPRDLDLQVSHGTEKIISAPEEKPVVKAEEPKPALVKAEAPKAVSAPAAIAKIEEKIVSENLPAPEAAKPAVAKTEPTSGTPAKAAAKPVPAPSGMYIQLGAYRDVKGAKEQWAALEKKYPELLKGMTMKTEVNIGPKGTLNRLQAGRVSESRAKEICETLRKGGTTGCILVR
ncbi:MAG: SPOR domain-containing protein [Alphaproteobacteria bacterium]|nr:MAG: SPOR domain-containing protein [Alphaproteobacteria bacterium]